MKKRFLRIILVSLMTMFLVILPVNAANVDINPMTADSFEVLVCDHADWLITSEGNSNIGFTENGDIIRLTKDFDFVDGKSFNKIIIGVAANVVQGDATNVTLRIDTADGDIIGTVDLSGKGGAGWAAYADYEGNLSKPVTGVHKLVLELVVSNDHGNAFNINHVNLVGDGTAPVGVASTAIAVTTKTTATASATTAKASATATKSTTTSQVSKASATSAPGANKGSSITPFIIGGIAVVVIAGGIVGYIIIKKKK